MTMPDPQTYPFIFAALTLGALVGAIGYRMWHGKALDFLRSELTVLRGKVKLQEAIEEERALAMRQAEERLTASFSKLAHESLDQSGRNFLRLAQESLGKHHEHAKAGLLEREKAVEALVKPIQLALETTHKQIGEIERTRRESLGGIKAQLEAMTVDQKSLQKHTRNLVNALRKPEVRGQWGELTLRRIAELSGMVEHCDFVEQQHVAGEDGAIRPDMVVRLPDHGQVVVDVKTPLDAYIQAIEAEDDAARDTALKRHARNVRERVRELAAKSYWSQFETSPEFVILFIPGDQFLSAAMNELPNLHEEAMRQKVIIATPTSLVALLKTIAHGWRQLALAENAEEIRQLAEDLHGRLTAFTGHIAKLGKQIEGSVKAYNSAVGSLERNVLPGARKFTELGVRGRKSLEQLNAVELMPREIGGVARSDDSPSDESIAGDDSPNAQLTKVAVDKSEPNDSPASR
jgi:DNA recombination protein RmuC